MPRRRQQSNEDDDGVDPLTRVLGLYQMFSPEAQANTDLAEARARYFGRVDPATEVRKTEAEIGEIGAHAGQLKASGEREATLGHLAIVQMLQAMNPDNPEVGTNYLTSLQDDSPTTRAIKGSLQPMMALSAAQKRMMSGKPAPGDEGLVLEKNPLVYSTLKKTMLDKRKELGITEPLPGSTPAPTATPSPTGAPTPQVSPEAIQERFGLLNPPTNAVAPDFLKTLVSGLLSLKR